MAIPIRSIGIITSILLAVLVVLKPNVFYTEDATLLKTPSSSTSTALTSSSTLSIALVASARQKLEYINKRIVHTMADITLTENKIQKIRSERKWGSSLTPSQQRDIDTLSEKGQLQYQILTSLHHVKEEMKSQQRALSPIFSQTAVEESREVWWNVQQAHGGVSVQMWKWDVLLDMIFGGSYDSRDSFLAVIVTAIAKLLWRLTFGVIVGIMDFMVRLPFYLKEYALYTSAEHEEILHLFETVYTPQQRITSASTTQTTSTPSSSTPSHDDDDDTINIDDTQHDQPQQRERGRRVKAKSTTTHHMDDDEDIGVYSEELMNEQRLHQQLLVEVKKLESISNRARQMAHDRNINSSWWDSLTALAFWQLAMLGSMGAGLLLVAVIWSPAMILWLVARYAQNQQHLHTD